MQNRSSLLTIRIRLSTAAVFTFVATCACVLGCQRLTPPKPQTGGDAPVTSRRLADTRLTDIKEPLSWRFTDSTVVIDYEGQPIPSDVVEALLGDGSTPVRVEASWRLDEQAGELCLTNVKTDRASTDKEVTIPITPAGQVRVNLGSRQYNLFRDGAKAP